MRAIEIWKSIVVVIVAIADNQVHEEGGILHRHSRVRRKKQWFVGGKRVFRDIGFFQQHLDDRHFHYASIF